MHHVPLAITVATVLRLGSTHRAGTTSADPAMKLVQECSIHQTGHVLVVTAMDRRMIVVCAGDLLITSRLENKHEQSVPSFSLLFSAVVVLFPLLRPSLL